MIACIFLLCSPVSWHVALVVPWPDLPEFLTVHAMLVCHAGSVEKLACIPGTNLLFSAAKDGDVKLWDLTSGRAVNVWQKLHDKCTFLNARGFGAVTQVSISFVKAPLLVSGLSHVNPCPAGGYNGYCHVLPWVVQLWWRWCGMPYTISITCSNKKLHATLCVWA